MYRLDMKNEQYDVLSRIVRNIINNIIMEDGEFTPSDVEVILSMGAILNDSRYVPELRRV